MAIFGKCGDSDSSSSDSSEEIERERKRRVTPIIKRNSQDESDVRLDEFGLPVYQEKSQSVPTGYTHINLGTDKERSLMRGPKIYNINKESGYRVDKLFSNMKISDPKAYIKDFHNFEHKNNEENVRREEIKLPEEKREEERTNNYVPTAPYNEDFTNFIQEHHQREIEGMMRKYEILQKESYEMQQKMNAELLETRKEVEFLKKIAQEKERELQKQQEQEKEREEDENLRENLKRTTGFNKERSRYLRSKFKKAYRGKDST